MVLAQPFKVHQYKANAGDEWDTINFICLNLVHWAQDNPSLSSLHILHLLFSDSALHYIYTHIYTYRHVSLTLTWPFFLASDSAVIQPPLCSLPWGCSTVQWSNNQPSSTGHLVFPMELPQGSLWLERAMTGKRRRKKRWALAWQHRELPVTSCRRKLYLPPEALLWLKALSTWETAGTNVLRLIIWIIFVHYILQ